MQSKSSSANPKSFIALIHCNSLIVDFVVSHWEIASWPPLEKRKYRGTVKREREREKRRNEKEEEEKEKKKKRVRERRKDKKVGSRKTNLVAQRVSYVFVAAERVILERSSPRGLLVRRRLG